MSKNNKVPDAWDDDWEALADPAEEEPKPRPSAVESQAPLTKAERIRKHQEEQRKLWESAEAPPEINYLAATTTVPLATPFKPAVKLLSRKPAPQMIAKRDPVTGLEQLTLVDDEAGEESKKPQPTPEEIRKRQQRELEEKQRRYEEARAKIFGDSNPSSGQSTPGTVTPPHSGEGRHNYRGRGGRGRGNRGGNRQDDPNRRPQQDQKSSDETRELFDPNSSPKPEFNGRPSSGTRELFDPSNSPKPSNTSRELCDPNYSPKPGFNVQKRNGDGSPLQGSRSGTPRQEEQAIRAPRGPDSSGRGGFGFARRGTRES